jgi:hypothetical protein
MQSQQVLFVRHYFTLCTNDLRYGHGEFDFVPHSIQCKNKITENVQFSNWTRTDNVADCHSQTRISAWTEFIIGSSIDIYIEMS